MLLKLKGLFIMTSLNNKGQSLVLFILIIPILFLILIIVGDIGNALSSKQELDNVNYMTIEYGLDHVNEDNLENVLKNMIDINNVSYDEIIVDVKNDKIYITIKKDIEGILAKEFKIFSIESSYQGYIINNKKIIERVWYYD